MIAAPRSWRPRSRLIASAMPVLALSLAAACSADQRLPVGPDARSPKLAASVTSTTYTLSSVTPPIVCTDAAGATTTVTGGTVTLSSNGKFTAQFTTETTSDGVTTTSAYAEKGSYTQSGSAITFKVSGGGTYTGTLESGTLTITDYPLCGTTHTAVFV